MMLSKSGVGKRKLSGSEKRKLSGSEGQEPAFENKKKTTGNSMNNFSATGTVAGHSCEMIMDTWIKHYDFLADLRISRGKCKLVLDPVDVNVNTATGEMTAIRSLDSYWVSCCRA